MKLFILYKDGQNASRQNEGKIGRCTCRCTCHHWPSCKKQVSARLLLSIRLKSHFVVLPLSGLPNDWCKGLFLLLDIDEQGACDVGASCVLKWWCAQDGSSLFKGPFKKIGPPFMANLMESFKSGIGVASKQVSSTWRSSLLDVAGFTVQPRHHERR